MSDDSELGCKSERKNGTGWSDQSGETIHTDTRSIMEATEDLFGARRCHCPVA